MFDLKKCTFSLSLRTSKETTAENPSSFYLPEFHFPRDRCVVETSGGKWEIFTEDESGVQRLRWWHGKGQQSIKVEGVQQIMNGDGPQGSEEGGYYAMINNFFGQWS